MEKQQAYSFRAVCPAGSTKKFEQIIPGAATVEKVRVHFYQGQQKALHIVPVVVHKSKERENIIDFPTGTDPYLSGDNEDLVYDVSIPVGNLDKLVVEANNTDPVNDYSIVVDIMLDFENGQKRAVQ